MSKSTINAPVNLKWETIDKKNKIDRAKIVGGWLVANRTNEIEGLEMGMNLGEFHIAYPKIQSICFVPDLNHTWGKQPQESKTGN